MNEQPEPQQIKQKIKQLAAPDDAHRQQARDYLRAHGEAALPLLLAGLKHGDSTIRGGCADLLGEIGAAEAREPLIDLLRRDHSRWVRSRAKSALMSLGGVPDDVAFGGFDDRIPPPADTLNMIRGQQPERLTAPSAKSDAPPPSAPPAESGGDDYTPQKIQALLDQLDVRLIKGEISEATYNRLTERWESRLAALRRDDD